MAGTGGAGDGRDGRRRDMLDISLNELRSECRGVETTGGARARRGVVCWFRRVDVPDPQRGFVLFCFVCLTPDATLSFPR